MLPTFKQKLVRKLRWMFTRKHTGAIICTLWTTGIGVGMAAYSPPVPEEFFYLSYLLLVGAILWSVGAYLCSNFIGIKKWSKNQHVYRAWQIIVPVGVLLLGGRCLLWVRSIQIGRELLSMKGVLAPGNASTPSRIECRNDNMMKIDLGGIVVETPNDHVTVLGSVKKSGSHDVDKVLIALDRENGAVALTLHAYNQDMKEVINIDRNNFEINRNLIFDSVSPPRPNPNTIRVRDEEGNRLTIRLTNKNLVTFRGNLYFFPGEQYSATPTSEGIPGGGQFVSRDDFVACIAQPKGQDFPALLVLEQ